MCVQAVVIFILFEINTIHSHPFTTMKRIANMIRLNIHEVIIYKKLIHHETFPEDFRI